MLHLHVWRHSTIVVASTRYPLHRLQVMNGITLSRSTLDCRGAWVLAAAVFALADALRVTADFGGLPFLRFGGTTISAGEFTSF